jgi:hypothetical protein
MSAHFKWYPASEEVVVPWNARYSFPSQANKAVKITPRIPPKNGSVFNPGQVVRLEFPAQGYVNPLNTTLEFDVTLYTFATSTGAGICRFQNNIQSIFNRVRLLYGATPLEDMINYNVIVRGLTEWTATNTHHSMDYTAVSEGIGGCSVASDNKSYFGITNVRQKYIQGTCIATPASDVSANFTGGYGFSNVPQASDTAGSPSATTGTFVTRRYQVNFALGLFTQDKLIPAKFMASQLAVEISLEQPAACIYVPPTSLTTATYSVGTAPTYSVSNVNLIPEILEFDASYDSMFLAGLRDGGVPIKFSSWHTFLFSSSSAASCNLLVQERSRSVKALFAVQRRAQPTFFTDSHSMFMDTSSDSTTLQNYQFRIGGRYFPAAPVQVSSSVGSAYCNGGAEAYVELAKALNMVGDYRLSSGINPARWGFQNGFIAETQTAPGFASTVASGILNEFDYTMSTGALSNAGFPAIRGIESRNNSFCGALGSACFAMATDLETSNGVEISGLNAEEQSDISLIANWKSPQVTGSSYTINSNAIAGGLPSALEVYSYYDAMIVLRENNVLELIQ